MNDRMMVRVGRRIRGTMTHNRVSQAMDVRRDLIGLAFVTCASRCAAVVLTVVGGAR